ncbi:MAG TPA: NADH-quinone oxidoreductase subunit M [Candidatus Acidoferrum sp.]|nr:NADH-quinone oxidoreductase subunit M [Candidatus Acidoferrum sp.]
MLSLVTFLPLLGVAAMLLLKSDDQIWLRRIALVTSIIEFLISLLLLRGFNSADPSFQLQEIHNWIGSGIRYHLGIDGISLFLVILTTFLTPLAILCSWQSIQKNVKGFFISLLVIETAMIGVFVSLDLFLFFVFWELTLIPMYFIVGMWGHERRIYAAIKFILYTMFGSILMLVAILWLYNLSPGTQGLAATFDFPQILQRMSAGLIPMGSTTEMLLFGAFLLAFAIKVPLFPLHTWLPDAHTEAPTAGSVILAGVMLKLGTYGILRFCVPLFPHAVMRAAPVVGTLAIIGIVYGALVATVQRDLKRLVAYTSVSHLGFVVLGIFALNTIAVQGAVYQMLNHGISTGALFLCVGMLYDRRHTHDIKQFGGLTTPMPVLMAFFCFIALSSLALPPLNGFIGEFLILIGTFATHHTWAAWATSGAVLSAIYLLWAYQRVAFGKVTVDKNQKLPDASLREKLILATVAVVIIFMGVASPLFTHRMQASADNVLRPFNQMQEAMRAKANHQARVAQGLSPVRSDVQSSVSPAFCRCVGFHVAQVFRPEGFGSVALTCADAACCSNLAELLLSGHETPQSPTRRAGFAELFVSGHDFSHAVAGPTKNSGFSRWVGTRPSGRANVHTTKNRALALSLSGGRSLSAVAGFSSDMTAAALSGVLTPEAGSSRVLTGLNQ